MLDGLGKMINKKVTYLGLAGLIAASLSCRSCRESKDYGCLARNVCEEKDESYECDINGRFYAHSTGIRISPGDRLEIKAEGEIEWNYDHKGGADKTEHTWGLWMKLGYGGKALIYVGKEVEWTYKVVDGFLEGTLTYIGNESNLKEKELFFIIPDGSDNKHCPGTYGSYCRDNSGELRVKIKVSRG